jgi:hypothetical protein
MSVGPNGELIMLCSWSVGWVEKRGYKKGLEGRENGI